MVHFNADYVVNLISFVYNAITCFAFLAFGIANAAVSSESTGAKGACGAAVWYCVMVLAILGFCAFFGGILTAMSWDANKSNYNEIGGTYLAVCIWACVAHYDMSDHCAAFYQEEYSALWHLLFANAAFFFANLACFGLLIALFLFACVYGFLRACFNMCFGSEGDDNSGGATVAQVLAAQPGQLSYPARAPYPSYPSRAEYGTSHVTSASGHIDTIA